jgi:hypothetical protein
MMGTGGFVNDEMKQNAAEAFQVAQQNLVMGKAMENLRGPKKQKKTRKAPVIKGKSGDLHRSDDEDDNSEDDLDFDFDEDDEEFNRLRDQRLQMV